MQPKIVLLDSSFKTKSKTLTHTHTPTNNIHKKLFVLHHNSDEIQFFLTFPFLPSLTHLFSCCQCCCRCRRRKKNYAKACFDITRLKVISSNILKQKAAGYDAESSTLFLCMQLVAASLFTLLLLKLCSDKVQRQFYLSFYRSPSLSLTHSSSFSLNFLFFLHTRSKICPGIFLFCFC